MTKNVNKALHFEQCTHELTVNIMLQSGWTKKQNISGRKKEKSFCIFVLIKQSKNNFKKSKNSKWLSNVLIYCSCRDNINIGTYCCLLSLL